MEILQESRLVKIKVLVFVGFCVVGVILALTIAVGVLVNKSQDVIYFNLPINQRVVLQDTPSILQIWILCFRIFNAFLTGRQLCLSLLSWR
jgi:hypothetical protein